MSQTCEPWTSIKISQENLSAWPVDGYLTYLNEYFHVILEDEIIEDTTNPTTNDHPVLDTNGDDAGRAKLQNSVKEIETLEGLLNVYDGKNVQGAIAQHSVSAVEDAVYRLCSPRAAVPTPPDHNPPTTATFQQTDVIPLDGYANMTTTKWSWARCFPLLYCPSYIEHNGEMRWFVPHDITRWYCVR